IAIAVSQWLAKYADMPIVVQPAQLAVVGDVAEDKIIAHGVPGRPFGPQDRLAVDIAVPQTLDRGVALNQPAERGIDCQNVWILEIDRRRRKVARWICRCGRWSGRTRATWWWGRLIIRRSGKCDRWGHRRRTRHGGRRSEDRATNPCGAVAVRL